MIPVRLIARLDIKGPNVVKGVRLEGLRVVGKPGDFARRYYDQGADEILFVDIVASLYGRNNILDVVERTAREIFIPMTVGGGIRTLEDSGAALPRKRGQGGDQHRGHPAPGPVARRRLNASAASALC